METTDKRKEETDRDVEFSYAIKAGKRIYYMDVRKTRKDDLYLSITESKRIMPANGDVTRASFEKHKIFLYKEDFTKFIDGLSKAIRYIHDNQPGSPANTDSMPEEQFRDETQEPIPDTDTLLEIDF